MRPQQIPNRLREAPITVLAALTGRRSSSNVDGKPNTIASTHSLKGRQHAGKKTKPPLRSSALAAATGGAAREARLRGRPRPLGCRPLPPARALLYGDDKCEPGSLRAPSARRLYKGPPLCVRHRRVRLAGEGHDLVLRAHARWIDEPFRGALDLRTPVGVSYGGGERGDARAEAHALQEGGLRERTVVGRCEGA